MDIFNLKGKTCLITGGNRGIGLGFAEGLAQAGANIVIWGSNSANNEAALKHLSTISKAKVIAQQVDVSKEDAVTQAFTDMLSQTKTINAVFANAGIGLPAGTFADMETAAYRKVLAVNVDGVFFTLRAASKAMIAQGTGGSLITVASLAAIEGAARNQHYSASKGAVVAMTRSIAVEHGRYGIRANAILPGWIATDMTDGMQHNDAFTKKVLPRVPIRRWGEPKDFRGIAVYLASDASAYHTGDSFIIDGGYRVF